MTAFISNIYTGFSEMLSGIYNTWMQDDAFRETSRFGAAQWKEYAGLDIEATEPPESLVQAADNPSPFFPGHTIKQTHILCCIPKDLSVEKLYEIFGKKTSSLDDEYKEKNPKTYWCWVAKKPALGSLPEFAVQEQLLKEKGHEAPFHLEVAVAIYAVHNLNGSILFPDQDHATNCRKGSTAPESVTILGGDSTKFVCGYAAGWRSPGIASVIR